jgi:putative Mg2+ transporter-C (MgtC) family protein
MWDLTTLLRLALAVVLGGLIGFERETEGKPAGLRTHALVCLGAALFMLISIQSPEFFPGAKTVDPGRIAAGVVTGIGFLGAGTIMQAKGSVKGLTTAASIWAVAAIGLAIGVGYYITAAVATALALAVLHLPDEIAKRFGKGRG